MTPFRRTDDSAARSSVAAADFGNTEGGLFSPQEVRRLMRIEFERAQRYKYPLACLLIAVDRLERLSDLHGMETKETILRSLSELLRAETRASDLLGVLVDDRLLVMIPHAPRTGTDALAKRLLEGARKLKFESDGRKVRITLAIGGSHNQTAKPIQRLFYETLLSVAESGLDVALQGGGDRYVHTELYDWFQKRAERELPRGALSPTPSPGALFGQDPSSPLQPEYVPGMRIFADPEAAARARALAAAAHVAPAAIVASLSNEREQDYRRQIDNLERRIVKLNEMLERTEQDLSRMAALKLVDPGVASIYRSVQGISPEDEAKALKKELMQKIFEANLELRNAVTGHAAGA
ncbi:MAG TPA: diguanylate cyclase [Planctomycetota bacterium]|nr:diguanylate cyclase [Planctomycetota bacterium]